ncbi:hypothetical protein [Streptomyces sp. MMG1121]|uniref:hypothetical protein n=1 Tax=Streptomyces sp. MMG1121 TaxID=1415544 RepID=UPI0006AF9887|nr:hypothetical protein [Streptomyces sp. MMG1121]KOV55635.1 hypothetical protein ADK64_42360 [Streptomyces sp. MMG1121]
MAKGILGKIGRRGAAAAAAVALAAGGVGLAAGNASADAYWYSFPYHASGHGVGVYSQPHANNQLKVAGDLSSVAGSQDEIRIECWVTSDNINNQGDVWYRVQGTYSPRYGYYTGQAFVYGAYVDNYWYWHNEWQSGGIGRCP